MKLCQRIDHTLLNPGADRRDIHKLVAEATEHRFAAVCVNGIYVADVATALRGSGIATCGVVGFPLGASKTTVKAIEAATVVKDGATEVDFVAYLPHLLRGDFLSAKGEFIEVVRAARAANPQVVLKVIIESALLMSDGDREQIKCRIESACRAARESGCDFVKTSTGFHPAGGASVEAVRLMRQYADGLQIKASGGIRSFEDAERLLEAGADRLGCSASVQIIAGQT